MLGSHWRAWIALREGDAREAEADARAAYDVVPEVSWLRHFAASALIDVLVDRDQLAAAQAVLAEAGGAGEIELAEFRDEEITLRAASGAHGGLRLNVSYFPKWHATRDGVPVPITPATDPEVERSAFMEVPLLL